MAGPLTPDEILRRQNALTTPALPGGTTPSPVPAALVPPVPPSITAGLPTFNPPAAANSGVEVIRGSQVTPATSPATPGGVPGGFVDPRPSIAAGFDQQVAYRNQGLQDIMAAAQQGNPNNYSFRLGRLVDALGPNNFAAIQGQGVNSLNGALAGVTSAGIGAGAQEYGANIGLQANTDRINEARYNADTTPVPVGQDSVTDPLTNMITSRTRYAVRGQPGGMPTPINPAPTTPTRPTLDQFLPAARLKNPGVSDADLRAYYTKAYGQ